MRTTKNLHIHELIGLKVRISNSSLRELIGTDGRIVNETKNLLIIETKNKEKKIPKNSCTFEFELETGEKVEIKGREIAFRPEERTKKAQTKIK